MKFFVNEIECDEATSFCISDAVKKYSPFGAEPVIVTLNSQIQCSDSKILLKNNDKLAIYPRLIGG